ncbi:MAG: serpin family protein [Muribaculaceae bacterium]|nr:serpin family protein [Muribaculaceae bacterium]
MKKAIILAAAVLSLGLAACSDENEQKEQIQLTPPVKLQLTVAETASAKDANNLGLRTFAEIYTTENPLPAFSPLSAQMAMALTANGATDETLDEMLGALCGGGSLDALNSLYGKLYETLPVTDAATTLTMANSVWHSDYVALLPEFTELAAETYGAPTSGFAKEKKSEAAATVNGWISNATNGLVRDMVDAEDFEAEVLLVNALYFKSMWAQKFNKKNTRKERFTNIDGSASDVDMMHATVDNVYYTTSGKASMVALTFGNGAYCMNIALPAEGVSPAEAMLQLDEHHAGWSCGRVEVKMPRFSAETRIDLKDAYTALGMRSAFSQNARFDGLSDTPLFISKVKHMSRFDVDETGAEGAASTVVEMGYTGTGQTAGTPETVFSITLNRPFAYTVSETSTGIIVFMGAVNKL